MLSEDQIRITFELVGIPLERMNEESPIYISCPFEHRHTKITRERDCQLYFDSGPHIFCFHESCKEELGEWCQLLRFEVTGSCRGDYEFNGASLGPKPDRELAEKVRANRATLIQKHTGKIKVAPVSITSLELLATRFKPEDVLWIGNEFHSGPRFSNHFRTLAEWTRKPPPLSWDYTVGASFWPDSFRRNNESVAQRRYLILESDRTNPDGNPLSRQEQLAMLVWVRNELGLKLVAIIFSGHVSLHGWFSWPGDDWLREHKPALEAMGFDINATGKSQPVRLGGAINLKTRQKQEVLWLRK